MEEIILANGKPTSLKKAVLFRLIIAFAIFAFVSLYYAFDVNGCQRHSVYVGEIHLAQYDTTLPGHTEINKVDFVGFLVSALVFEVEITKSIFIPLLVYGSILMFVWGILHFLKYWNISLTVTNKRLYGVNRFGKRVDIPLRSITSVSTSRKHDILFFTPSGKVVFRNFQNADEIYQIISKMIADQQSPSSPLLWEQTSGTKDGLYEQYPEETAVFSSPNPDAPSVREDDPFHVPEKKTKKKAMIFLSVLAIAAIIAASVFTFVNVQQKKEKEAAYESAISMMEAGKYAEAINAFVELGSYKDCEELIVTSFKQALELPLDDELYQDMLSFSYDAAQGVFSYNLYLDNYYSSQGFSKEDYIETYGSEENYNKALLDFAKGLWEQLDSTFGGLEINIPCQICLYESSDSSSPVLCYPED